MHTLENLLEVCTKNNRICPKPKYWIKLSDAIGKYKPNDDLTPLILAGWTYSDDEMKQERLIKQVEFALTQPDGMRDKFIEVLLSIAEDDWHHSKEV
jgi:hypothetical protein